MSLLDESKKVKKTVKKDKEINDLTKNIKSLNEGMIMGFDTFDKSKIKNNIRVIKNNVLTSLNLL